MKAVPMGFTPGNSIMKDANTMLIYEGMNSICLKPFPDQLNLSHVFFLV